MHLLSTVIDPKLRRDLPSYIFQCLLATLVLLVLLLARNVLTNAVVVSAIGSTAFVLFIMPIARWPSLATSWAGTR